MLDRIGDDEQLIFTTHNTDMLDLNLPKHSYVFLRKHLQEGVYQVSAVSASDVLKRNTDSLRCAARMICLPRLRRIRFWRIGNGLYHGLRHRTYHWLCP